LQKKQVDNDPDDPFSQLSFYVVQVGGIATFLVRKYFIFPDDISDCLRLILRLKGVREFPDGGTQKKRFRGSYPEKTDIFQAHSISA
jgi:hypothetical protein